MRRTGIIIGLPAGTTPDTARRVRDGLKTTYPGVELSVVGGATGMVAFEFDDGERAPVGTPIRTTGEKGER